MDYAISPVAQPMRHGQQKNIYSFKGLWRRRHIFSDAPSSANERMVEEVQVFAFREVRLDSASSIKSCDTANLSIWVATSVAHLSTFNNQR